MINGVPETKEEYDAIINPDEYNRRMRLTEQGMMNARQNNAKKVRMLERLAKKKKRFDLADKFDI